jgi:hypothetical protein
VLDGAVDIELGVIFVACFVQHASIRVETPR